MPRRAGPNKLSGDIHLPDVESDLDLEQGKSSLATLATPRKSAGRRSTVRRAGLLRAEDTVEAPDGGSAPGRALVVVDKGREIRPLQRRSLPLGKIALWALGLLVLRRILR